MARECELTVLTTCARDDSWADVDTPGADDVGGVRVHRFRVDYPLSPELRDRLERAVLAGPTSAELERRWLEQTGPWSSALMTKLTQTVAEVDLALFFAHWSPTTVGGLPLAARRSILVPMVRDPRHLRISLLQSTFAQAGRIVFASSEERALVQAEMHCTVPAVVCPPLDTSEPGIAEVFLPPSTRDQAVPRGRATGA